jgi:RNA polymerase sigma-70 factor (ECF subfamily)
MNNIGADRMDIAKGNRAASPMVAQAAVFAQSSNEPECAALVAEAAAGTQAAFARLYDLYAQPVYNMILRSVRDAATAEDVAQEVWTKVHRELRTLREPRCFSAWLYRIAAKKCIDAARRKARRPAAAPLTDEMRATFGDPERSTIEREDAARIWEALATLSPKQHMALYLREVERRTYRDIAYVLNISETAVGLCIFRARRALLSTYQHLEDASVDGCASALHMMSLVSDGQATPIQARALEVHLQRCASCRSGHSSAQAAARGYGGLPLVLAPAGLREQILGATSAAKCSAASSVGNLVSWLLPNVKAAAVAGGIAATAGVTTAVAAPLAAQIINRDVAQEVAQPRSPVIANTDGEPPSNHADTGMSSNVSSSEDGNARELEPGLQEAPSLPATPIITLLDGDTLPGTEMLGPLSDELVGDLTTSVDSTLDPALTAVDETIPDVDDTIAEVSETLDDITETDMSVPVPELDVTPSPEPGDVTEPLEEALEPLPVLP